MPMSPDDLLAQAQILLDRVLFVAFAEDRPLLPGSTLRDALSFVDKSPSDRSRDDAAGARAGGNARRCRLDRDVERRRFHGRHVDRGTSVGR
jgi:hypothetical protein